MNDAAVAVDLAAAAGRILQGFRSGFRAPEGVDPRAAAMKLRDGADAESQMYLGGQLARLRPDDAVLSEEAADSTVRDNADRVWIIDPLDGTWEYGLGRSDWAVHVALWERAAAGVTVGAVALPDEELVFDSSRPPQLPPLALDRPLRVIASRSRPPAELPRIAAALADAWSTLGGPNKTEIVQVGSVGAKVGRLLTGRAEVYVHNTGFYEWDVAAPLAVARAAGLQARHIDGSEVGFNNRPPWVSDLLVCRHELEPALNGALA